MTKEISKSFLKTKRFLNEHHDYPTQPGIYAFYLSDNANLPDFGISGQLIYIGIAKYSLHDRDFKQHFNSGKTGSSTLRRSIGAILKGKLKLTAIPRGGENDTKRFYNYKFKKEQALTDWMLSNLQIGYWVPNQILTYKQLRDKETFITIELKPTLDLDPRTKKYNPLADKLDILRKVCRLEAENQKNMRAAFHYVVKAKLVRFKKGSDIDFLEFEERFEDENPIIARNKAFIHYQNYIDVLLQFKNKEYNSDRQVRQELNSFIDPGTKTTIKIQETEFEISDSLGNGIGIFMVIDKLKPNTDDKIGDELFIHGIGSIGLSYDLDYVIFHLNLEFDYYKYFEYDTENKDIEVIYCNRGEWEEGYREGEPAIYNILRTPFDWDGYEKPYWWGEPGDEEDIEIQQPQKTVLEIIKGGENNTVEFKPSLLYNFTTGKPGIGIKAIIAKAICAFLNSNGGWLFIGINDKGGVQGLEYDFQLADGKNPMDFFRLEFDQMLEHFLTFSIKSNVIGKFYQIDGKDIFLVTVTPNKRRPIFLKGREGKEFYVRGEASSRQITDVEEIVNYCIDRG